MAGVCKSGHFYMKFHTEPPKMLVYAETASKGDNDFKQVVVQDSTTGLLGSKLNFVRCKVQKGHRPSFLFFFALLLSTWSSGADRACRRESWRIIVCNR